MSLKECKICGETKEAIKGIWVTTKGKPEGRVCLACTAQRSAEKYHSDEKHEAYKAAARLRRQKVRAEYAEYYRKYVEANRDKLRQY